MATPFDGTASESYPGPPLRSYQEIRLLVVEPDVPHKPIHCHLEILKIAKGLTYNPFESRPVTTNATQALPYDALSYVWGNAAERRPIYVRSTRTGKYQEYPVTTNCFTALNRLRLREGSRNMWIDAICIDQENLKERGQQVALMADIYSQATRVVVYLGEATAGSDLAMKYLSGLKVIGNGQERRLVNEESSSLPKSKSELDDLARAINGLFRRPWFDRVWVIQEIALAQEAIIVCGDKEVDWWALRSIPDAELNEMYPPGLNELPYVCRVPYSLDPSSFTYSEEPMFEQVLEARKCLATDPRDKIFSLVSFLRALDCRAYMDPDYTKSHEEVFIEFAERSIFKRGLKVLCAVQSPPKVAHLPSWVPDWSIPPLRKSMGLDTYWHVDPPDQEDMHQVRVYRPEIDKSAQINLEKQRPTLQVFGRCEGRVNEVGPAYVAGEGPFPFAAWNSLLIETLGSGSESPPGKTWLDFFGFIHVHDIDPPLKTTSMDKFVALEAEHESGANTDSWNSTVRALANSRADQSRPLSHTNIPFGNAYSDVGSDSNLEVRTTLEFSHNQRIFTTHTGRVGVGPVDLRPGDEVYKCVGLPVTFAFREEETPTKARGYKTVRLVGECLLNNEFLKNQDVSREGLDCLHIV